ncbi:hypothetical protein ACOSP7_017880 [Xanthoceras sorbifolium]
MEPQRIRRNKSMNLMVINDENCRKVSFKKRKSTLKKKASQLSTMCDVNVCMVCFGPDGTVETWPENRSDVLDLMVKNKNMSEKSREEGKQKYNLLGFLEDKKRKLSEKLKRRVEEEIMGKNLKESMLKNNLGSAVSGWDERLDLFSKEELVGLCGSVDSKLYEMREKIRFLQMIKKEKAAEVQTSQVVHVDDPNNLNYDLMKFNGDCFYNNQQNWPRDYHGRMMSSNFGWCDNSDFGIPENLPFLDENYNNDHMGMFDIINNVVFQKKISLGFADHANMGLKTESFGLMGESSDNHCFQSDNHFIFSHTSPWSAVHQVLPVSMRPSPQFSDQSPY